MRLRYDHEFAVSFGLFLLGPPRSPRCEDHEPDGQADEAAGREYEQHPRFEVRTEQVDAQECSGTEDFANRAEADEGEAEPEAAAQTVEHSLHDGVFGSVALSTFQRNAVGNDERDECAERLIDRDADGFHKIVDDSNRCCDDGDVARDAHLVRRDFSNHGDKAVGERQHKRGGQSHGNGVAHAVGDGERRTHAEHRHEHRVVFPKAVYEGAVIGGGCLGVAHYLPRWMRSRFRAMTGVTAATLFSSARPTARDDMVAPEMASISQAFRLLPCLTVVMGWPWLASSFLKLARKSGSDRILSPRPGVSRISTTWKPVIVRESGLKEYMMEITSAYPRSLVSSTRPSRLPFDS